MTLIVLALAAWVVVRSLAHVTSGGMRYQVERATLFFVVVGLAARVTRARRAIASSPSDAVEHFPAWTVILWWSSALVMYWSALWIGFLSDDFVLADRAARGAIGPVTPKLFRPIPLALWGLILRVGGGTTAIHLINILLHGTNAYLATRIAQAYVRDRLTILLVGILVLCFPLSVEAVAWASGVFDVMATTWILIGVLIARGYGSSPSVPQRIALWACAAAALLSKETAVIMPLLIGLDMWARDAFPRTLILDVCMLLALDVGVGAIRLTSGLQVVHWPIGKVMVQRWIFGTLVFRLAREQRPFAPTRHCRCLGDCDFVSRHASGSPAALAKGG